MGGFVLDTSAVLTLLNSENGFEIIISLLDKGKEQHETIYLPFMTLMELEYLSLRRIGPEETMALITLVKAWPVEIVESNDEWRHQAAQVKAKNQLSVSDAWIASLALNNEAELVHKDPEYDLVPGLHVLKLPYKSTKKS